MSLLSHKELQIAIYPGRIAWHRGRRQVSRHGYLRETDGQGIISCDAAGEGAPWLGPIRGLETALPSLAGPKTELNVTLSNQFVQYILVPWLDKLSDQEELSFAQHCFRDTYGDAADSWSVRVSPGAAGFATIASAVDTGLLEELRALATRCGLNIKSIQPNLMTAYNGCRAALARRSAWLAFLEPGSLCLVLQQGGRFAWVRKMRVGEEWREDLAVILERETYLSEARPETTDVLLWAPHLDEADLPVSGRWNIQPLKPGSNPDHRLDFAGLQKLVAA